MNLRIKAIRKHFGKTQKEFGESLGVSRDTFASYESGRVEPSKTFIQLLCAEYSVNETWLRTGDGKMLVETINDHADRLAVEYGLSFYIKTVLKSYMNLNDSHKSVIDSFLHDLTEAWKNAPAADSASVDEAAEPLRAQAAEDMAAVEAEADAFADIAAENARKRARAEFISEKIQASPVSTAKGSGAG